MKAAVVTAFDRPLEIVDRTGQLIGVVSEADLVGGRGGATAFAAREGDDR